MSVSVLILTFNEEINLHPLFESLKWCDDIVILDSFSVDQTVKIARENNARVLQRKFDNFANQRNYALDKVSFKHDWVLHLDADEIVTKKLYLEIIKAVNQSKYEAFKIPSKIMFFNKWLRYSGMYPVYQVRLGHRQKLRFQKSGHGQKENLSNDKIGIIEEPYIHYTFSKGLNDWFDKHNRYSTDEALESLQNKSIGINFFGCISNDKTKRRRSLKVISMYLPFRPLLRFIYMYFLRLGFLDGYAGLLYCRLLAIYEHMIVTKVKILTLKKKN